MPRVAVFIDGSNLYHGVKRAGLKQKLDLPKLAALLVGDRDLVRTYYYVAPVPQAMDPEGAKAQQRFLQRLHEAPYLDVRLGRLTRRGRRWEEKGVDALLCTDMVYMAAKGLYEVAILVSGDGDLAATAQAVKDLGKHVENAYFRKGRSDALVQRSDKFIEFTPEFLKDCLLPLPEAEEHDAEELPLSATQLNSQSD
jgi:uncharacterized LabA/DUF88 family protein